MAIQDGFVWFRHKYRWLDKGMQLSLFYWSQDAEWMTNDQVATIAVEMRDLILADAMGEPNVGMFKSCLSTAAIYEGFDVLVKGRIGTTPAVSSHAVTEAGTRGGVSTDAMPRQTTASAYAKATVYGRQGARCALSGSYEQDQANGEWNTTATGFWDSFQDFLNGWTGVGNFVTTSVPDGLFSCVVGRIEYTTPSGKPANRLPLELTDVVNAVRVDSWSVSRVVAGNNKRKKKLRGS